MYETTQCNLFRSSYAMTGEVDKLFSIMEITKKVWLFRRKLHFFFLFHPHINNILCDLAFEEIETKVHSWRSVIFFSFGGFRGVNGKIGRKRVENFSSSYFRSLGKGYETGKQRIVKLWSKWDGPSTELIFFVALVWMAENGHRDKMFKTNHGDRGGSFWPYR